MMLFTVARSGGSGSPKASRRSAAVALMASGASKNCVQRHSPHRSRSSARHGGSGLHALQPVFDGLRGKQKLVGEHVILNHRVGRNSESGEENGAEHPGAVLARGAVLDDRQVARSDALKNLAILPRVLDGVIVTANRFFGLRVNSSDSSFQVVRCRARNQI